MVQWYHHILVISAMIGICSPIQGQEKVRCALLADRNTAAQSSALIPPLEACLSQEEGLELLERRQVEKLLEEQQLSLTGLTQREGAIRAGRLLRAQAFVLLSIEPGPRQGRGPTRPLVRVRVAETAHGLRLWESYEPCDEPNIPKLVPHLANRVAAVLGKLAVPSRPAIPVGIIDIHRVQIDERYDLLTRALPRLLSARLSTEPRLIIVEREDLGLLLKEKQLTEGEDAAFWDSAVLVDGTLRPAANGGLEVALRWRRAGSEQSRIIPVDPNTPASAVDTAATAIVQSIVQALSLPPWEVAKEAEEFFRQGCLLSVNRRYSEATSCLETAHALQPGSVPFTEAILANEWSARYRNIGGYSQNEIQSFYSDLELTEIVSRLVRQMRDRYDEGRLSGSAVLGTLGGMPALEPSLWGYFTSSVSTATEQIRGINRENRAIWIAVIQRVLQTPPHQPGGVSRMMPTVRAKPIQAAWVSSDVPQEIIANVRKVFTQSLQAPGSKELRYSDWKSWLQLSPIASSCLAGDTTRTYLRDRAQECWKLWLQYLVELTDADNPVLKFLCARKMLGYVSDDPRHKDKAQIERWRRRTIRIAQDEIKTLNEPFPGALRWDIRRELRPYLTLDEFEEICELLLAADDAENLAWWAPAGPGLPLYDPEHPGVHVLDICDPSLPIDKTKRFYQLLGRVAEVLRKHPPDSQTEFHLGIQMNGVLTTITDVRTKLEDKYPDLDESRASAVPSVTMLVHEEDWPREVMTPQRAKMAGTSVSLGGFDIQVQLRGKMLWTAFLEYPRSSGLSVGLAGVDLPERQCRTLYQTEVRDVLVHHLWQLTGLTVQEDAIYVAHHCGGILQFPGEQAQGKRLLPKPMILGRDHGLPSEAITAMTGQGKTLWVAYGGPEEECGLGRYDPRTHRWDTIFCSTIKGEPPFNSGYPYCIYALVPVEPNSLFLLVGEFQNARGVGPKVPEGLWKMTIDTHAVEYMERIRNLLPWDMNVEFLADRLWFKTVTHVLEFNPISRRMLVICGNPKLLPRMYSRPGYPWPRLEYELFIPPSAAEQLVVGYSGFDASSSAIYEDQMWARNGDSGIMVLRRGQGLEQARNLKNNLLDGEPIRRFVSTPYGLVAIGDGVVGLVQTQNPPPAASK